MTPETNDRLAYVTDWQPYPHFGNQAYRIWMRRVVGVWMQRHEWRKSDETIETQEWIGSMQPPKRWIETTTIMPVEDDA